LPTLRTPEDGNFQLYTIRLRLERLVVNRDALIEALGRRGVSARLYYPPLHLQRVFARDGHRTDDSTLPNAVEFGRTALSLPIFPTLSAKEQDYVIKVLRDALRACRR
jgi:dTDP-4-amino-4,6-dideoxygalactose transaminase